MKPRFACLLVIASLARFSALCAARTNQFLEAPQYQTGLIAQSVAVGDFNGDGKQDIAVANNESASISILLGKGNGTFQAHVDYPTPTTLVSLAIGDFNGDGKADVVVACGQSNVIGLLLGNGDGTFQPHVDFATGKNPVKTSSPC